MFRVLAGQKGRRQTGPSKDASRCRHSGAVDRDVRSLHPRIPKLDLSVVNSTCSVRDNIPVEAVFVVPPLGGIVAATKPQVQVNPVLRTAQLPEWNVSLHKPIQFFDCDFKNVIKSITCSSVALSNNPLGINDLFEKALCSTFSASIRIVFPFRSLITIPSTDS